MEGGRCGSPQPQGASGDRSLSDETELSPGLLSPRPLSPGLLSPGPLSFPSG